MKNPLHLKMQKTYVKRSEYDHVIKTHLFLFSIFIIIWSAISRSYCSTSNLCLSSFMLKKQITTVNESKYLSNYSLQIETDGGGVS